MAEELNIKNQDNEDLNFDLKNQKFENNQLEQENQALREEIHLLRDHVYSHNEESKHLHTFKYLQNHSAIKLQDQSQISGNQGNQNKLSQKFDKIVNLLVASRFV